jgi:hypothetical protein
MTNSLPSLSRPYPTLGQAWILFLIFVAMNIGASFLVMPFQESAPNFGFFLAYCAGMGATYFIARQLRGRAPDERVHRFHAGNWAVYPILLFATWACMLFIMPVVELYPPPDWLQELMENLIDTSSIWAFLSLVVAAPLFEELVFRGIILDGFLKQYSVRKSILWSAFFFGLYHLNPWQFITAMGLGIFIGWIYHRTRSLLPCIAIHAFANGTSFFLSAGMTDEQQDMTLVETVGGITNLLLVLAGAGVVLYVGIRLLDRLLPAAPVEMVPAASGEEE